MSTLMNYTHVYIIITRPTLSYCGWGELENTSKTTTWEASVYLGGKREIEEESSAIAHNIETCEWSRDTVLIAVYIIKWVLRSSYSALH